MSHQSSSVLTTTDINGGTIDGATINTSDITVGTGKALDITYGTLILRMIKSAVIKLKEEQLMLQQSICSHQRLEILRMLIPLPLIQENLEITNIKARDGTSSATIVNSTGVMTISSASVNDN